MNIRLLSLVIIALIITIKAETSTNTIYSYPAHNSDAYTPGTQWQMVWADEFNANTLNPKNWTRQELLKPYNEEWEQYVNKKDNAYVKDGYLILKAIHTSKTHGDKQYTSARLHTGGKQQWQYGKIVARIQLPYGKGIWPAFWMLGADIDEIGGNTPWPKSGEIDILELYGTKSNGVVEANMHWDHNGHQMMGAKHFSLKKGAFAEAFHTFELEWNKKELIWRVDGVEYSRAAINKEGMEEFHKKYYILLNIAVGGTWAGRPDSSTHFPQYMFVDWVRVYQKK